MDKYEMLVELARQVKSEWQHRSVGYYQLDGWSLDLAWEHAPYMVDTFMTTNQERAEYERRVADLKLMGVRLSWQGDGAVFEKIRSTGAVGGFILGDPLQTVLHILSVVAKRAIVNPIMELMA